MRLFFGMYHENINDGFNFKCLCTRSFEYNVAPFKQINLAAPFFFLVLLHVFLSLLSLTLHREWVYCAMYVLQYKTQHNLVLPTSSFYLFNHPFFCVLEHAYTHTDTQRILHKIIFLFVYCSFLFESLYCMQEKKNSFNVL